MVLNIMRNHTKARGRKLPGHTSGKMNSTERKYAREVLDPALKAGEIISFTFEAFTIRLGPKRTSWTPDFVVLRKDRELEMVDVKGTRPDESAQRTKIKMAAHQWPAFHFVVARQRLKRDGGGFQREEIGA